MSHTLALPNLGLPDTPVQVSVWRVGVGRWISAGDHLLEVVAGEVSVEIPAPVSGTLVERCVQEDDLVRVGQPLAVIEQ